MSHRLKFLISFLIGISTVLVAAESAIAREIDREKTVTTEQIHLGQALPKTLVVRIKADTHQVEVLHLNQALKADPKNRQLISTSSFIKVNSKGRMVGELDRDSSSSSWGFYMGYPGYGYGYGNGYGYGYGNGYGYGCGGYSYYSSCYYPSYSYCGYNYPYVPYYSYYSAGYYYGYYGWPYTNQYCAY